MRTAIAGFALFLACSASPARATSTVPVDASATADADSFAAKYEQQQRERFDLLRSDSSPRVQVLAGHIYLDSDDPANKLLPKRTDVVARAVRLAPDDALVQWIAADQGNYSSSACGPTTWPDAEVANLVRLEPNNAAAWQYEVALASAKGDDARVDDALAHMAAASQARDHQAEVAKIWTKLDTDHPELLRQAYAYAMDNESGEDTSARPSAATRALLDGLQQTERYNFAIDKALESACKPDANSEATWQRAGWCARAGELLAARGNSFSLRDTGLKMLTAAGATPNDLANLKRNQQYLIENAAVPMRNPRLFGELDTIVADWNGAADEIAATQNRLKRLGKPLTPPAGWVAQADTEKAEEKAAESAWGNYLDEVVNDLRASADVRERALGLSIRVPSDESGASANTDATADDASPKSTPTNIALSNLATANPNDLAVQWIAATTRGGDSAILRVQQLDPDNAAAWTLSFNLPTNPAAALHQAAAARRFDDHSVASISLLNAAFKRHPMPTELRTRWQESLDDNAGPVPDSDTVMAFSSAVSTAMGSMTVTPFAKLPQVCHSDGSEMDAATKTDCVALARVMLNSKASLLSALFGAVTLAKLDTPTDLDRLTMRQLAWLQTQTRAASQDYGRYIDDYFATGSEVEALRRAMTRAGKLDPPADWQPPQWLKAATSKGAAASK